MKSRELEDRRRAAFEESLREGRRFLLDSNIDEAWPAFERAHVLGQAIAVLHVRSHWWMLRCGLKQHDVREVLGQIVRLSLSAPSSWLGRYPLGNTGRARVGLFRPMPLPREMEAILAPPNSRESV